MQRAVDGDRRRIDAMRRQQLVLGGKVGGGKADLAPAFGALDDEAFDDVVMTEQGAGLVHPPLADQAADARARDDEVFVADRIDLLRPEAMLRAERSQEAEVAAAVASEQEISPDPHFRDAQP